MSKVKRALSGLVVATMTLVGLVVGVTPTYAASAWQASCYYEWGSQVNQAFPCPPALVNDAVAGATAAGFTPSPQQSWSTSWGLFDMDPAPLGGVPWPVDQIGSPRLCSMQPNSFWAIQPASCVYTGSNAVGGVALVLRGSPEPFDPQTDDLDPAAAPDTGHVPVGAASVRVAILDNDDLPNGIKALELVSLPGHGEATIDFTADGWPIDYAPESGFVGQDTFSYRVTDDLDKTSETTVVITIDGPQVEDPPAPPTAPPVVPPTTTPPAADPTPTATPTAVPFQAATGLEASNGSSLVWWISITGGTVLLGLLLAAAARRRGAL